MSRYATIAKVRRYVQLARDLDLDVAGFEVSPDGTIRVLDTRASERHERAESDFDRLKDQL